jgi:predicted PurR-regulated permease PerM
MSNFQELLDERNHWTLDSDQKLIEKIKNLEFNIFQSAEAIHKSIEEMSTLCQNASTALNNSINSFSYMKYTKFIENVMLAIFKI